MAPQRPRGLTVSAVVLLCAWLVATPVISQQQPNGTTSAPSTAEADQTTTATQTTQEAILVSDILTALDSAGLVSPFFLEAIDLLDMSHILSDMSSPVTLFAPSFRAESLVNPGVLDDLKRPSNRGKLRSLVLAHIAEESLNTSALSEKSTLTVSSGASIPVSFNGDVVRVNGAAITLQDIAADNGYVQVISVIFTDLIADSLQSTISDTTPDLTTIGEATTSMTTSATPTATASPSTPSAGGDGLSTKLQDLNLQLLSQLIEAVGLGFVLQLPGPITIFAPTDDAIRAGLPSGLVDAVLDGNNQTVITAAVDIISRHIVPSRLYSAQLIDGSSMVSVTNEYIFINHDSQRGVLVEDAAITQADVEASNGNVHVIDTLLFSPLKLPAVTAPITTASDKIVDMLAQSGSHQTLLLLLQDLGLTQLLSETNRQPVTLFAPTDAAFAALFSPDQLSMLRAPANRTVLGTLLQHHFFFASAPPQTMYDGRQLLLAMGAKAVAMREQGWLRFRLKSVTEPAPSTEAIWVSTATQQQPDVIYVLDNALWLPGLDTEDAVSTAPNASFVEFLGNSTDLSLFRQLVAATDLESLIASATNSSSTLQGVTIFAPSDAALERLGSAFVVGLLAPDRAEDLNLFLSNHITVGQLSLNQLMQQGSAETLAGQTYDVDSQAGLPRIGEAIVSVPGAFEAGPVVHILEEALVPPSLAPTASPSVSTGPDDNTLNGRLASTPVFSTLSAMVTSAGLKASLSDENAEITIFAPTNAAFAALPSQVVSYFETPQGANDLLVILQHHMVAASLSPESLQDGRSFTTFASLFDVVRISRPNGDDQTAFVDDARLNISSPFTATNGFIYAIDKVLIPDGLVDLPTTTTTTTSTSTADGSVAGILVQACGSCTRFIGALQASGLAVALAQQPSVTLFLPTDEGLEAKLPAYVFEMFSSSPSADQVRDVILNHVVYGTTLDEADDFSGLSEVTTQLGVSLEVKVTGGNVRVAGALLSSPQLASNGVAYVLPPDEAFVPGSVSTTTTTTSTSTTSTTSSTTSDGSVSYPTVWSALFSEQTTFGNASLLFETALLRETLDDATRNLTTFVPSAKVLSSLSQDQWSFLLAFDNLDSLSALMGAHVSLQWLWLSGQQGVFTIPAVSGDSIAATMLSNGTAVINDRAHVVPPSIRTENGIIYVVDSFVVPPVFTATSTATQQSSSAQPSATTSGSTSAADTSLYSLLSTSPSFSWFAQIVERAGLDGVLRVESGPFTVLALTNAALADAMPQGVDFDTFIASVSPSLLTQLVELHTIRGELSSSALANLASVEVIGGVQVPVRISGGNLFVNDVSVSRTFEREASNGLVLQAASPMLELVLSSTTAGPQQSTPLTPSTAELPSSANVLAAANRTLLLSLISAAGASLSLPDAPYVLLAPANEAFLAISERFEELLSLADAEQTFADLISNHLLVNVSSSGLLLGTAVTTAYGSVYPVQSTGVLSTAVGPATLKSGAIEFDDGLVYLVDVALVPAQLEDAVSALLRQLDNMTLTTATPPDSGSTSPQTPLSDRTATHVRERLAGLGLATTFDTFFQLADEVGLFGQLPSAPSPLALWIPDDDAFDNIPSDVVPFLLDNPDELQRLLLHHGAAQTVVSANFSRPPLRVQTLANTRVSLGLGLSDMLTIDGSMVRASSQADGEEVTFSIYVISDVLFPPPPGTTPATTPLPSYESLTQLLEERQDLSVLASLVPLVNATRSLDASSGITLFAPPDSVFESLLSVDQLAALRSERYRDVLETILLNHVVLSPLTTLDFVGGSVLPAASSSLLEVSVDNNGTVRVADVEVDFPGIPLASVSRVHTVQGIIDPNNVLAPLLSPTTTAPLVNNVQVALTNRDDVSIFFDLMLETGLFSQLGNTTRTVLAPMDQALGLLSPTLFAWLGQGRLGDVRTYMELYMIEAEISFFDLQMLNSVSVVQGGQLAVTVDGENLLVGGASVAGAQQAVDGSIIFLSDALPLDLVALTTTRGSNTPSSSAGLTTPGAATSLAPVADDLVSALGVLGGFEMLLAAINSASLSATLSTGGPFTLLAPQDAAFDNLSPEQQLIYLSETNLPSLVKHHVVFGSRLLMDLNDGDELSTLNGDVVVVDKHGGKTRIDGIEVVSAAPAGNGVVLTMASVLLPPGLTTTTSTTTSTTSTSPFVGAGVFAILQNRQDTVLFAQAATLADLSEELSDGGPYTVLAPSSQTLQQSSEFMVLLASKNSRLLENFVKAHLVKDTAFFTVSIILQGPAKLTTLGGRKVTIRNQNSQFTIDGDATIVDEDNVADNGVVHVIDGMLAVPEIPTTTTTTTTSTTTSSTTSSTTSLGRTATTTATKPSDGTRSTTVNDVTSAGTGTSTPPATSSLEGSSTTPSGGPLSTSEPDLSGSSSDNLDAGVIAGAIVGALILVVLIVVVAILVRRRSAGASLSTPRHPQHQASQRSVGSSKTLVIGGMSDEAAESSTDAVDDTRSEAGSEVSIMRSMTQYESSVMMPDLTQDTAV